MIPFRSSRGVFCIYSCFLFLRTPSFPTTPPLHTYEYTHTHIYSYASIPTCSVHTHLYTYIYTSTQAHTHTHPMCTHTHTHTLQLTLKQHRFVLHESLTRGYFSVVMTTVAHSPSWLNPRMRRNLGYRGQTISSL